MKVCDNFKEQDYLVHVLSNMDIAIKYRLFCSMLCLCILYFLFPPNEVIAQEFRFAISQRESGPLHQGANRFSEEILSCYGDQVNIVILDGGQLGSEREYVPMVSQGVVAFAFVNARHLESISQYATILGFPFLFGNSGVWEAVIQDNLLDHINTETLSNSGIRVLGFSGGSHLNIISTIPIIDTRDFSGKKIRSLIDDRNAYALQSLGFIPESVSFQEAIILLSSNNISASETFISSIEVSGLYQVAPYVSLTEHFVSTYFLIVSEVFYQSLDDELRECVISAGISSTKYAREIERELEGAAIDRLENEGVIFNRIVDRARMFGMTSAALSRFARERGIEEYYNVVEQSSCPTWCDTSHCTDSACHACSFCKQ